MTRGWILNEIFRRVEPNGRTIGEFLRDEIAEPLKLSQVLRIGGDLVPRQNLTSPKISSILIGSLMPKFLSSKVEVRKKKVLKNHYEITYVKFEQI